MSVGRRIIEDGVKYERAGAMNRALECYGEVLKAEGVSDDEHSEALRRIAEVKRTKCDWDEALHYVRLAQQTAETAGLETRLAEALNAEGSIHMCQGHLERALELFQRAQNHADTPRVLGASYQNQGSIAAMHGGLDQAEEHFLKALDCYQEADYQWGMTNIEANLGQLALDQGDLPLAQERLLHAQKRARVLGDMHILGLVTLNLADVHLKQGQLQEALREVSEAVGHFTATEDRYHRVEAFGVLGDIYRQRGIVESARVAYQRAATDAKEIGAQVEQKLFEEKIRSLPTLIHERKP